MSIHFHANTPLQRVFLHLFALLRHGHARWHLQGILRELPWHR